MGRALPQTAARLKVAAAVFRKLSRPVSVRQRSCDPMITVQTCVRRFWIVLRPVSKHFRSGENRSLKSKARRSSRPFDMGGHQIIARHWPSEFEECISNTVFGAHHSLELRFECVEGFAEGNKV